MAEDRNYLMFYSQAILSLEELCKRRIKNYSELNIEGLFNNLEDSKKNKLIKLILVYEWCCLSDNANGLRDEFKLIISISIIEDLMSGSDYVKIENYLKINLKNLKDFDSIVKKYYSEFGLTRKVRKFWDNYLSNSEQEELCSLVKKVRLNPKDEESKPMELKDLANLLYQIRSSFVHSAELSIFFKNEIADYAVISKNKKNIISRLTIDKYLEFFEIGFIRYFFPDII